MKMVLMLFLVSTAAFGEVPDIKYGLHFDSKGMIIRPDELF